jgi:ABC-type spermidine/putrescine transport system permease subunit II
MTTQPRRARFLTIWMWFVVAALYVPLAAMVLMSFNESRYGVLPFHLSTRWYQTLSADNPLVVSTLVSLELAFYVTATCVTVGTALGFWLSRTRLGKLRMTANAALLMSITIPILILSVGMLAVFQQLGLGQSAVSLWLGCTLISLPYMVFVVVARLQAVDPSLVPAARSLGSGAWGSFWRVTVPLLRSAMVAGSLMAFVVCFNNFVVQLFLAPVGVQTLPVNIYAQTRVGITPDINAVSSIIIVATVLLVLALQLVTGSAARVITGQQKDRTNG